MKSSASIYECSGSQLFKTTTGIQPGPDAFDELRFIMTFSNILGVTEILCKFKLVQEEKTGIEIRQKSQVPGFWEVMGQLLYDTEV